MPVTGHTVCHPRAFKTPQLKGLPANLGLALAVILMAVAPLAFGQSPRADSKTIPKGAVSPGGKLQANIDAKLDLANLDQLADKASQTVDVSLDEKMINLATKFLSSSRSSNEAKLKEIVSKLKGVYVRSLEFDHSGQYSASDITPLLLQLGGQAWTRVVAAASKKGGEDVRVYVMKSPDDSIQGLAVLIMEPRELTVVNIVGPIDIEKISELEGNFGIPKLGLEPKASPEK